MIGGGDFDAIIERMELYTGEPIILGALRIG
jgi:hypothetical protein